MHAQAVQKTDQSEKKLSVSTKKDVNSKEWTNIFFRSSAFMFSGADFWFFFFELSLLVLLPKLG